MKLLVRNLNRKTTEEDINDLFKDHGIVNSCDLVLDEATGKSKGFGFVEMSTTVDAEKAMKLLDGKVIAGNKIHVKKAKTEM